MNAFLDADDVDAARVLVDRVQVVVAGADDARGEARKIFCRQRDLHGRNALRARGEQAVDIKYRRACFGLQLQDRLQRRGRGFALKGNQVAIGKHLQAVVAEYMGKLVALALARVTRDERALALFADQDVGGDQFRDTGAYREHRHAEAFGELAFDRQLAARFPFAFRQALQDLLFDLLVERRGGMHLQRSA